MLIYKLYKKIKNPQRAVIDFCKNKNYRYAHLVPDKLFVKCMYKVYTGRKLNLKNPILFNEKLQWLKLYNRNPEYINMVDKAAAKKIVSEKCGDEYVIPTVGIYDNVNDIPFDDLPNSFVIKCTHDSGSVILCRDKASLDIPKIKEELENELAVNFFWFGREWPYKYVKPKIIIEKALFDENGNAPIDYKFFCFDGSVKFFQVDFDRFSSRKSNYYDVDCNLLPFEKAKCRSDSSIEFKRPEKFSDMISAAEKLSRGLPFLRVDLYYFHNKIYFGEMTFFPGSGCLRLVSNSVDAEKIIGDMINLPKKRVEK